MMVGEETDDISDSDHCLSYYTVFAPPPPPPKLALFDVFKIKALGNMQFSQEHLKTTVYAKFGDQGGCIMGDSKIENWSSLSLPRRRMQPNLMRDGPFRRK